MKVVRFAEKPYVAASHEDPAKPGVLKRVLAEHGDFLDGRVQMVNFALLPGSSSFRPHYHQDMQEMFVILTGRVALEASEKEVVLEKGDAVLIQPREIHSMRNLLDTPAEYVVVGITRGQGGKTVVI